MLYSYEEMVADLAKHFNAEPSLENSEPIEHLLQQTRYTKLFSDVCDKPKTLSEAHNAFILYQIEHLIPPLDKEPEAGFNLYYSTTPLSRKQASDMTALFEYFGTYTDHTDVPLDKLPETAVQFMILGEDFSFVRMHKELR